MFLDNLQLHEEAEVVNEEDATDGEDRDDEDRDDDYAKTENKINYSLYYVYFTNYYPVNYHIIL